MCEAGLFNVKMTLNKGHAPIRILHIIGNVCGGGVESVVMNYYHHIDREKIQFDFVIDGYGESLLDAEILRLGGRIYKVEPYVKNIFRYIYQIACIVKKNRYEIVHSHMNTLAVFSLFAAWAAGARVRIVHNHTMTDKTEILRSILKYILRPFGSIFANCYFSCSKMAAAWMFGNKNISKDVRIIHNAIDVKKFFFSENSRLKYRNELDISPETLVLGHVGRFVHAKNHEFLIDVLLEVLRRNKNVILLLIGDGPLYQKVKRKAEQIGCRANVKFLGLRKDVAELYNVMDIFLLPSWYEGLPIVSIEAQANGLPCLISDRISDECKITPLVTFMSLNLSAQDWAECIIRIPRIRNMMAGKDLRMAGFDIEIEARKLQSIYEGIAAHEKSI